MGFTKDHAYRRTMAPHTELMIQNTVGIAVKKQMMRTSNHLRKMRLADRKAQPETHEIHHFEPGSHFSRNATTAACSTKQYYI
jgi:hypothetical protein